MILELVKAEVLKSVDEIANEILADEKSIVGKHSKSGAAVGSLHIESTGEFSRFIGANVGNNSKDGGLHAFFLDEGNGSGGIPKSPPPKRPMPMTYGTGKAKGFAVHARNYKGIHWVRTVASHF